MHNVVYVSTYGGFNCAKRYQCAPMADLIVQTPLGLGQFQVVCFTTDCMYLPQGTCVSDRVPYVLFDYILNRIAQVKCLIRFYRYT